MTALTYAQLEGVWIAAGGDPSAASTMAAIAFPESSANPASIQQGQPYATTGWGLWQITPGNSVPTVGINQALLDPLTNARAAVAKFNASKKARGNGFLPWTTYTSGKYLRFMQNGVAPTTQGLTLSGATSAVSGSVPAGSTAATLSSYDPSACLIGWSGIGGGGSFCLFTKSEARALIGGMFMLTGALTTVVGLVLLFGSMNTTQQIATSVAPEPVKEAAKVVKATTPPAPAQPVTRTSTVSGVISDQKMKDQAEFPSKSGTLRPPAARKRTPAKKKPTTARKAATAPVEA